MLNNDQLKDIDTMASDLSKSYYVSAFMWFQ
jgi:hypothetical protein